MDLIYTNANKVDQGVLSSYSFDLSFGADENDFELTLNDKDIMLEYGAIVYCEGTEYGGIVDGKHYSSDGDTITYKGRTWTGILNGKIIEPPADSDNYIIDDFADSAIAEIFGGLGLEDLFSPKFSLDGGFRPYVKYYTFPRYCKAYDAIRAMLTSAGAKLRLIYTHRRVFATIEPIQEYSPWDSDGDAAILDVEHYKNKVNHLICLGQGEGTSREVRHLCVDNTGDIYIGKPHYTGSDEITDVYDNSNAKTFQELVDGGAKRLEELRKTDKAEILNMGELYRDIGIGDIIHTYDFKSGIRAKAAVTQKIVKIENGKATIEYKTGG